MTSPQPSPPPRVAIAIVGAARDSLNAARLARYVVAPMAPAEVFVLWKAIHFNGTAYTPAETASLSQRAERLLRPVFANITSTDYAWLRFHAVSREACACLFPERGRVLERHFALWWGALQMVWDAINAYELRRSHHFETVVVVRADVVFHAPIRTQREVAARTFYTAVDPPDAFWILPRAQARHVLQTASLMTRCAREPACCSVMTNCYEDDLMHTISWYLPCYWGAQEHMAALVPDSKVRMTVHAHQDRRHGWLGSAGVRFNKTDGSVSHVASEGELTEQETNSLAQSWPIWCMTKAKRCIWHNSTTLPITNGGVSRNRIVEPAPSAVLREGNVLRWKTHQSYTYYNR